MFVSVDPQGLEMESLVQDEGGTTNDEIVAADEIDSNGTSTVRRSLRPSKSITKQIV